MGLTKSFVKRKTEAASRGSDRLAALLERRNRIRGRQVSLEGVQRVSEEPEKPRKRNRVQLLPVLEARNPVVQDQVVEYRAPVSVLDADTKVHSDDVHPPVDVPVDVHARRDPDGTLIITLRIRAIGRHY